MQKQAEKKARSQSQWPMIKCIKKYLLIYGLIDFTFQVIVQMPYTLADSDKLEMIGIRKIWVTSADVDTLFSYKNFINS